MKFDEARIIVANRLFEWGEDSIRQEIENGFPCLTGKRGAGPEVLKYLSDQSVGLRNEMTQALMTKAHPGMVFKKYGAPSPVVKEIINGIDNAWSRGIAKSSFAHSSRTLADRRRLNGQVKTAYQKQYPHHCFDNKNQSGGLIFSGVVNGWTIVSDFFFGRWETKIELRHWVWTGRFVTRESPGVFGDGYNNLIHCTSYSANIGLSIPWTEICSDESELVCKQVMHECDKFVSACDRILDGIEFGRCN